MQRIVVIGGNGFIGSAVCRAALARGMDVTSISSSGRPYTTPKGHSPAWTARVKWHQGDALHPETFAHHLAGASGVVHTLGVLLEDGEYKTAIREGNVPALLGSFLGSMGAGRNPLERRSAKGTYDVMNRDAALCVCEAFLSSDPPPARSTPTRPPPRPFVYISAEDVFRPLIPARYIESKREAEQGIDALLAQRPGAFRGVYIRPSLVYHAHLRPLTSPLAALLDLSATVHAGVPRGLPTPSGVLRSLGAASPPSSSSAGSPLLSVANALTIPPIHVDHVAAAIAVALDPDRSDIRGAVGVRDMRRLIGWVEKGASGEEKHGSKATEPV